MGTYKQTLATSRMKQTYIYFVNLYNVHRWKNITYIHTLHYT